MKLVRIITLDIQTGKLMEEINVLVSEFTISNVVTAWLTHHKEPQSVIDENISFYSKCTPNVNTDDTMSFYEWEQLTHFQVIKDNLPDNTVTCAQVYFPITTDSLVEVGKVADAYDVNIPNHEQFAKAFIQLWVQNWPLDYMFDEACSDGVISHVDMYEGTLWSHKD